MTVQQLKLVDAKVQLCGPVSFQAFSLETNLVSSSVSVTPRLLDQSMHIQSLQVIH